MSGSDSEYPAGAGKAWTGDARLFDGLQSRPRRVLLTIGPDGLVFEWEGRTRHLQAGGFYVLDRGDADGFFRLGLSSPPGVVLVVEDGNAWETFMAHGFARKPLLHGMPAPRKIALLSVLLLALVGVLYGYGLDLAVEGILKFIPRQVDARLGQAVFASLPGFPEDEDAPGTDSLLDRALAHCARFAGSLEPSWEGDMRVLLVADSSVRNAFAFPGGYIVIYRGMLDRLSSQEELMGLLAHEAGHIVRRHGMRRIARSSLLALGTAVVFGDVTGVTSVILENGKLLASLSYGRKEETEADRFAMRKLEAAGYSSAGLAALFEKILAMEKGPALPVFLSTHPATEERIRSLRAEASGMRPAREDFLAPEEWRALVPKAGLDTP